MSQVIEQPRAQDGLPPGQRVWAVLALVFAIAMATLDTSIANTALPTIAADVNATPASSVWVVNAYQLALVATLLPFASLGEIFGYRRIYIYGWWCSHWARCCARCPGRCPR